MTHASSSLAAAAIAAGVLALAATLPARAGDHATVSLPAVFGDHMVLQRDRDVPVWGTAAPGEPVEVVLDARAPVRVVTGADGRWRVTLPPTSAGGPHELRVSGADTRVFRDVMFGEVWLASGQSNMEMPVDGWGKVFDADAEVASANHPDVRMLTVEHRIAYAPAGDVATSGWQPCSPASVKAFSATAYFFARALHDSLGVPVGILHASWGGTEIESWTRTSALANVPGMAAPLAAVAARGALSADSVRAEFQRATAAWWAGIPKGDRGTLASPPWSAATLDDRDWKSMTLPNDWENAGMPDLDGVVWFRRTVEVPAAWAGRPLTLSLGKIDDVDTTFFDGVAVGHDSVYDRPRVYTIPAERATPGPHVIAVRVFDWIGGGGLWGEASRMKLAPLGGAGEPIALDGAWRYRVALDLAELGPRPRDPDDPHQPGVLANAMIAPLVPYAMRGAIWYQGEQNAPRAEQYRALLPNLIRDWRRWWNAGDFPFLLVQLASFTDRADQPGESDWAELREAQTMTLATPHTGMALAIDIGDAEDIHPRNKQEVGRRLALLALAESYGRRVVARGPHVADVRFAGAEARVRFTLPDGALVSRTGGEPRGFALAGADRRFHWARARVAGDTVVLTCDAVPHPVAVRYAWANNPAADLAGGSGLPAEPFRSDRWPGLTHGKH